MKKLFFVLPFLIATLACTVEMEPVVVTATPVVETTADVVQTDEPVVESSATLLPTATAEPSATLPVQTPGGELIRNGNFESWVENKPALTELPGVETVYHLTPAEWNVWDTSVPYVAQTWMADYRCNTHGGPAQPECANVQGTGNDLDLVMGRPEHKRSDIVQPAQYYRVHGGDFAAQFFSYARPVFAGYQQEIWLPARDFDTECTFKIYIQVWANDGTGKGLTSTPASANHVPDDELAIRLYLAATDGLMFRSGTDLLAEKYVVHSGIEYDGYKQYKLKFTLSASQQYLYMVAGARTAWPWVTQNFYFDDASLVCNGLNF